MLDGGRMRIIRCMKRRSTHKPLVNDILESNTFENREVEKFLGITNPLSNIEFLNEKDKQSLYGFNPEHTLMTINHSKYDKNLSFSKSKSATRLQSEDSVINPPEAPQIVSLPVIATEATQEPQEHSIRYNSFKDLKFGQLSRMTQRRKYECIPIDRIVDYENQSYGGRYPVRTRIAPLKHWCESLEIDNGQIIGVWTKCYK